MLTTTATLFLSQNIGDVAPQVPTGEIGDKVSMLLGWLMWGAIIWLVGSLVYAAATLGVSKKHGGSDGGSALMWNLIGAVVVGASSGLINGLAF
ncbi:hypothetical protein [Rhodococcus sp. MEB064]|uniref:hypothetical protein n=1 Tax=Rhodococcus sp. MEB064 TaxID=1587522 RepID=UPI0005ACDA0A|nr:hypothetical protein [Rhodococcus sp. MEB064]KIQ14153.1 hypothetical protein RU01_17360 [Rhodococcus sp. MEB064]